MLCIHCFLIKRKKLFGRPNTCIYIFHFLLYARYTYVYHFVKYSEIFRKQSEIIKAAWCALTKVRNFYPLSRVAHSSSRTAISVSTRDTGEFGNACASRLSYTGWFIIFISPRFLAWVTSKQTTKKDVLIEGESFRPMKFEAAHKIYHHFAKYKFHS